MTSTSTPLDHTEEGRAFLQMRIGRFGLYGAALGGFFVVVRLLMAAVFERVLDEFDTSFTYHVLALLSLLGIWVACRGERRSVRALRLIEDTGLFLACSCYAAMGMYTPLAARPHYIVILALAFGLIARAIYVPSSLRRTLWLTSLCGIPLFVVTYLMYARMDIEPWTNLEPGIEELGAEGVARISLAFSFAWWTVVVATCAGASAVIYGLRKQVRSARKLGQYTLEGKLGSGAMGAVYRASHAMLRRPTAVKLLPPELAGVEHVARFEKEVQLTAMLTHPNTVTIYDYGRTPDGIFYYAMELLDGATLRDIVEVAGPQPAARVVAVLNAVAGALAEAHGVGLMHRDIKPGNIMLVEQSGKPDVAKVLDFGLVKELEPASTEELTLAGAITGTPQYLAPEAIRSPETVDARTDLYALGAVGYFLLTGTHVFNGETVLDICLKHLGSEPSSPSEQLGAAVPADLEALILRCLAKDPEDRPANALALQEALRDCEDFGEWSENDALAWWQSHREALAARREDEALTGPDHLLEVGLGERGAAEA